MANSVPMRLSRCKAVDIYHHVIVDVDVDVIVAVVGLPF